MLPFAPVQNTQQNAQEWALGQIIISPRLTALRDSLLHQKAQAHTPGFTVWSLPAPASSFAIPSEFTVSTTICWMITQQREHNNLVFLSTDIKYIWHQSVCYSTVYSVHLFIKDLCNGWPNKYINSNHSTPQLKTHIVGSPN